MATINVFAADAGEWARGRDLIPPERHHLYDPGELEGSRRIQHPGDDAALQMFEVRVPPNVAVAPHAHLESEIIFVVEGQLSFGSRTVEAGGSVMVPGMTLYSFRAGPDGVHFVNFRARADMTYYSKDEFMAMRRSGDLTGEAPAQSE